MKVAWILSEDIPKGLLDPITVKNIAASWGSWKTWKEFRTDNCVCHNTTEANNLIKRALHTLCNLFIMQSSYTRVGSPIGVNLFNGEFKSETIANRDDLIALNLVIPQADIVLMSGFNFSPLLNTDDEDIRKAREEYYFNVRELIKTNDTTQFVLVDYMHEMASWVGELDNVNLDTVGSVKSLLG